MVLKIAEAAVFCYDWIMKNVYTKYFFIFLSFFLILVLRRPDAVVNSQFWAEDGKFWFADANNIGAWQSIFLPQDGYFQTISRLTASFSQIFPITYSPLVFNLIALVVQLLPALFLVSPRLKNIFPNIYVRFGLALAFLLLPNIAEIHGNITHGQWYLAILAGLILIAGISHKKIWKIFDLVFVALSGLSGPFALFLAPVAVVRWRRSRQRWDLILLSFFSATALIQLASLLFLPSGDSRVISELASVPLLLEILGRQVYLGLLFGSGGAVWLVNSLPWANLLFFIAGLLGTLYLVFLFFRAPFELRLFSILAGLVLAASLFSPTGDLSGQSAWQLLFDSPGGIRYWIFPMTASLLLLTWSAFFSSSRVTRAIATLVILFLPIGIFMDFQIPAYQDLDFHREITEFSNAPYGHVQTIPINPMGWSMTLIKQ